MADSESFTSLMDLVNSHLSKVSVQANSSDEDSRFPIPRMPLPSLAGDSTTSISFPRFPGQLLPLPTLSTPDSSIQDVLAMQLSNMFIAKEKKKQEEEQKLAEKRQKIAKQSEKLDINKEDNSVIDLSQAVIDYSNIDDIAMPYRKEETLSNSSSHESLFEPNFISCDEGIQQTETPELLLPCIDDMSFILKRKIKHGRCSTFGKVLTSRLRPVAAPYLMEEIESSIERFDFSTKSPCDIIKEKLRKPSTSNEHKFELFHIFPHLELEFKKADLEFDNKK